MFVKYNLEDVKNNKVHLEHKSQKLDLETIIEQLKIEGFELANWNLIEIAKSEDKRVYGFENLNKNLFYMKIGEDRQAKPHYFKNHGLGKYSEFQAESIKDAIKQYENFYIVEEL
ncbi:hypothetical protein COJ90_21145 [Priestia megaterium]|uniref:hypothetical protein n=1 Tax=Priestia megaterium TaxID=1404 RepID=UPI000BFA4E48|nr:hypothetical protein [Priestia megaterium]PFP09222.1 hypothetical protein COJ90_21145 [Priestia megaterium]